MVKSSFVCTKIPCNPISEILQFPYFCDPRYLYTS